jgi:hypothetical protein
MRAPPSSQLAVFSGAQYDLVASCHLKLMNQTSGHHLTTCDPRLEVVAYVDMAISQLARLPPAVLHVHKPIMKRTPDLHRRHA